MCHRNYLTVNWFRKVYKEKGKQVAKIFKSYLAGFVKRDKGGGWGGGGGEKEKETDRQRDTVKDRRQRQKTEMP